MILPSFYHVITFPYYVVNTRFGVGMICVYAYLGDVMCCVVVIC
jgi:hypothetical protein